MLVIKCTFQKGISDKMGGVPGRELVKKMSLMRLYGLLGYKQPAGYLFA